MLWRPASPLVGQSILIQHIGVSANTMPRVLGFSPDNKSLLLGFSSDLQLYDLATLKEVFPWPGHRGRVDYVAFSRDGKQLITANTAGGLISKEVVRWDVASWKALNMTSARTPRLPALGVPSLDHSVYVGNDGPQRFQLFDMRDGKLLSNLIVPPRQNPAPFSFFSPCGQFYILDGGRDGKGKDISLLFTVPSGKFLCQVPAVAPNGNSTWPVAFFSDGRLAALRAREGGQIFVIDTGSGKLLHALGEGLKQGASGVGTNLMFSSDGKMLASWCMADKTVRSLGRGQRQTTRRLRRDAIRWARISGLVARRPHPGNRGEESAPTGVSDRQDPANPNRP